MFKYTLLFLLPLYKIGALIPTLGNIRGPPASLTSFILPRSPHSATSVAFWAFRWTEVEIRVLTSDLDLGLSPLGMRLGRGKGGS